RYPAIEGRPLVDLLLAPTRIYVKPLLALLGKVKVKAMAHITGGGITENLPRVLPDGVHAQVDPHAWSQGPLFDWLAAQGRIAPDEMRRTFNCGIGMTLVVSADDAAAALAELAALGETAFRIGEIAAGAGGVHYR